MADEIEGTTEEPRQDAPPAAPAEAAAEGAPGEPVAEGAEAAEPPLALDVAVEDAGACKKKLSITIPREAIDKRFDKRFTELEGEALVPGFRPGHAPRRLVEKRFRRAVAEEVQASLIADGLKQALALKNLDVIGEPDLDPKAIELPDEGPMTFSVGLEVRPEFTLPNYAGIPVNVERTEVTDKDVDAALGRIRSANSELKTMAKNAKAKRGDYVTGDLVIEVDGKKVVERAGAKLPVEPIVVEGIPLEALPEWVEGAKAGETRSAELEIGEECKRQDLRGKSASVSVAVHEIARPAPPDDKVLLERTDYESMDALKDGLRRQLEMEAEQAVARRQEAAVQEWLLEKTPFDLPEDLAKRNADRVAQREMVNLLYRGVPAEEIRKREDQIRAATGERAMRDLKLFFILDAIAKKEKIEATDAEVDARLRYIAAQYGR